METENRAGRIIGVLLLLLMVGSGIVSFALEAPLFGTPGFLVNAAPHARQLGLAALLGVGLEALWVGIAVTVFPILWRHSRPMAFGLVVLAGVVLAVAVVENIGVLSMVSLSEAYTKAAPLDRGPLAAARVVVASARNWAHYMGRIFDGVTIFLLFAALYRFALVPRILSGFGLLAALLMLTSVGRPLFGYAVVFPLLAPLGLAQLSLALWLLIRGFRAVPEDPSSPAV